MFHLEELVYRMYSIYKQRNPNTQSSHVDDKTGAAINNGQKVSLWNSHYCVFSLFYKTPLSLSLSDAKNYEELKTIHLLQIDHVVNGSLTFEDSDSDSSITLSMDP